MLQQMNGLWLLLLILIGAPVLWGLIDLHRDEARQRRERDQRREEAQWAPAECSQYNPRRRPDRDHAA